MENTKIEWCDHTFNPWKGCTKVSPACVNCYAETWAKRTGQSGLWSGDRQRTTIDYWKGPTKWNHDATSFETRPRVFCASLADVWDNQVPEEWRHDLFALIRATPALDWLLLTKRPQNIAKMQPPGDWVNVWLGTTVENMEEAARRIPVLLKAPAVVRFLSCEPLLEPLDLMPWLRTGGIHWVICGGENGPRRMEPKWARSLRDQCEATATAFFMKQMAGWRKFERAAIPVDLLVRQFPGSGSGQRLPDLGDADEDYRPPARHG